MRSTSNKTIPSVRAIERMADTVAARGQCIPDDPVEVYQLQLFALVPTIIIMTLSITTYALRLFCRKKTGQELGWDDYLMGLGLLISLEPSICELLCTSCQLLDNT